MRKILAALLIYLSVLGYSQGQNRFSDENNSTSLDEGHNQSRSEQQGSSNEVRTETSSRDSGCIIQGGIYDGFPDCNCDGTPDHLDDDECAPNPADPIPIDDYLPFLVITAVGLIIYVARNKKELLS